MKNRAITICVLEILREYSDEDHIMTTKDIINKLSIIYDMDLDRRTIYSAISLLNDLGYEISTYDDNGIGYYLLGRDFEQAEILLLANAIYSFPFIPAKQSEDLIAKLQKQLSVHQRKNYRHLTIVKEEKKTDNRQVFFNIEILDESIQEKKQVSFYYTKYGIDKKLKLRKNRPYKINPYRMIYTNGHYYVICNLSGTSNISFYRIDRIRDIEILDSDWDMEPKNDSDLINAMYAFPGKSEIVKMKCSRGILDDIIDQFGTGISIKSLGDEEIEVRMKIPPQGMIFWALQYLPYVEVLEPEWLRYEVVESIKANRYGI